MIVIIPLQRIKAHKVDRFVTIYKTKTAKSEYKACICKTAIEIDIENQSIH